MSSIEGSLGCAKELGDKQSDLRTVHVLQHIFLASVQDCHDNSTAAIFISLVRLLWLEEAKEMEMHVP